MSTIAGSGRTQAVRYLAVFAAAATACLYFLIGLRVLYIGESTSTSAADKPDIFAFGAMTGIAFAVTAILLYLFRSRPLWIAVIALQVIVLAGYVAISGQRNPPYEVWGLTIKALQVVILAAVVYLLARPARRA
jgi:hypothetical protein